MNRTWLKISVDYGGIWMDSSVKIVERISELKSKPKHFTHRKDGFIREKTAERCAFGGAG